MRKMSKNAWVFQMTGMAEAYPCEVSYRKAKVIKF